MIHVTITPWRGRPRHEKRVTAGLPARLAALAITVTTVAALAHTGTASRGASCLCEVFKRVHAQNAAIGGVRGHIRAVIPFTQPPGN
jgi:hypothetical protein